jgi:hypothetical protein
VVTKSKKIAGSPIPKKKEVFAAELERYIAFFQDVGNRESFGRLHTKGTVL